MYAAGREQNRNGGTSMNVMGSKAQIVKITCSAGDG